MIRIFLPLIFFPLFSLFSQQAAAHPVIYKGGGVYWGKFSHNANVQRAIYTLHPRWAIEANGEFYRHLQGYRDAKIGFNALVKRWALKDSQGNIYVGVHAGRYRQREPDGAVLHSGTVLHSILESDWESRQLYTALSVASLRLDHVDDQKRFEKWSYRIGFAPYVVGMDALQAWMIFKFDYFKEIEDKIKTTPMMRFFYKNALWEMGANLDSEFFLTLMVHY